MASWTAHKPQHTDDKSQITNSRMVINAGAVTSAVIS
jgi:hypothetical protein